MQAKLIQENNDHAQRAEVPMKEMDEMPKGLVEIQMRDGQSKLESSNASINDLYRQREGLTEMRMPEMAAIMTERDRQADERWKLMSDLMHRRDTGVDKRMVDPMTTIQDLTQGVKTVVTQTCSGT